MQRVAFLLLCLAGAGQAWQQAASAFAQVHSRLSAKNQQPAEVLARFLLSLHPTAGFHASSVPPVVALRPLLNSATKRSPLRWDRHGCCGPLMSASESSIGRRDALRAAATTLAAAAAASVATATVAREGSGKDAVPLEDISDPELRRQAEQVKEANLDQYRLEYDEEGRQIPGQAYGESTLLRTQIITKGPMSFQIPSIWKEREDGVWIDPTAGPVLHNYTLTEYELKGKTKLKSIKELKKDPNKVDMVKDLKMDQYMERADFVQITKRKVNKQPYYDYLLSLGKMPQDCPRSSVIACLPDLVSLVSSTVYDNKLYVFRADVVEEEWKRSKYDLEAMRKTFYVDPEYVKKGLDPNAIVKENLPIVSERA